MGHETTGPDGCRMLFIFTPGGFEDLLCEISRRGPPLLIVRAEISMRLMDANPRTASYICGVLREINGGAGQGATRARAAGKEPEMRRLLCCSIVVGGLLAGAGPALAADSDFGLVPVQGASWQLFTGLPDDPLAFGLTRQVSTTGDADLADVTGAQGTPTGSVTRLSLAVAPLPGGINPCWTVGFTAPDGTQHTVSLDAATDSRGVTATPLPGGWTQWTWTVALPQGTINQISLGVDVTLSPPVNDRVTFDEIAINTQHFDGPISSLLGPVL